MSDILKKVLERLAYERLLLVSGFYPRKRRIVLEDVLRAGAVEPRILQTLPAILLYKPSILYRIREDLKKYPKMEEQVSHLFERDALGGDFLGVSVDDCQKAASA